MSDNIVHVTDESYQADVLEAETPVVVDFWAPWCGPCRMLAPLLEDLADEYQGKLTIAKVNTDENVDRAGSLGIRSIPTLVFYSNGEETDRLTGFAPKPALKAKLDALLEKAAN
jgi:thioredoxin 1